MYTIGQVSEMFGLPVSTLRYYDQQGLFPQLQRSSGIRRFSLRDIETLHIIECLKMAGLEIKDIKRYMQWCLQGDETIGQRKALIDAQRQNVMNELQKLQDTLAILNYKQWYYETAEKAGTCAIHATMAEEDIPAEHHHARNLIKAHHNGRTGG